MLHPPSSILIPSSTVELAMTPADDREGNDNHPIKTVSPLPPDLASTNTCGMNHLILTWDDVEIGGLLGNGAFASVHQMKPLHPSLLNHPGLESENDLLDPEGSTSERSFPTHASRRFVLKFLSKETLSNVETTEVGIQGLKMEIQLLCQLPSHQNIIALVGASKDGFEEDPEEAFIILQRLPETLDERLKKWRNRIRCNKKSKKITILRNVLARKKHPLEDPEQHIRATHIGLGIAQGMAFLHSHGVLYRDMKPDNAGFDSCGTIRLFDFGLARRIEGGASNNDKKRLTICVGSLRYMSPEVYKGLHYSYPTDVYSFSILLWEILTLGKPYDKARSTDQLVDIAFTSKQRPPLKNVTSASIRKLLQACWDPNPDCRPTFASIVAALDAESRKSYHFGTVSTRDSMSRTF